MRYLAPDEYWRRKYLELLQIEYNNIKNVRTE